MKEIIRSLAVGLTLVTGNVFAEENDLRFFIGHNINTQDHSVYNIGVEKELLQLKDNTSILGAFEYHYSETKVKRKKEFAHYNSWTVISPVIKKHVNNEIYLKGGVGVAYMQEKRYGISKSGSHWQFAVNLGVGYEFNNKWSLEAKWRHFSNGATSYPNPGKDFYSVDVGYRF